VKPSNDFLAWSGEFSARAPKLYKSAYDFGHKEGFERGQKHAVWKIAALEIMIKRLEEMAAEDAWEALAYRELRDTANKEEIEYVLLGNVSPDEIDRRMRSLIRDMYPDPGFTPEAQSSPTSPPDAI
jgi:hypothetical protein